MSWGLLQEALLKKLIREEFGVGKKGYADRVVARLSEDEATSGLDLAYGQIRTLKSKWFPGEDMLYCSTWLTVQSC